MPNEPLNRADHGRKKGCESFLGLAAQIGAIQSDAVRPRATCLIRESGMLLYMFD
jgi:hypothetical protein